MFEFYDDELHNLILVSDKNFQEIIEYTSKYDFHPPLQYLVNKISLQLFGLNEFWLSLPSILFILLSIIICSRLVYEITNSVKFSILTGFLTAINPLIMLWGSSLRWYPLWTFLIILSAYLLISIWNNQRNKLIIIPGLIVTLSLSLYTNYQTLTFLTAGLLTILTLDIQKHNFKNLKITLFIFIGSIILFLPYLSGFIFHLQNFFIRKEIFQDFISVSPLTSAAYFLFSIFIGNSIYPWQLVFIIIFTLFAIASVISLILLVLINRKDFLTSEIKKSLSFVNNGHLNILSSLNIFIFYLMFIYLVQVMVTGTILMRGMIFLPMLLITAFSSSLFHFYQNHPVKSRLKVLRYSLSIAISSLIIIWLIGSYNIFTKQHLHKSGLMIPVAQIISTINKYEKFEKEKPAIVTTDPVLTYYFLKNNNTKLLSPYTDSILKLFPEKVLFPVNEHDKLFIIKNSPGALLPLKNKLDDFDNYLSNYGDLTIKPIKFGYDEDYFMKKKFFSSAGIEAWKYVFYIMYPTDKWDVSYLEKIKTFKVH